MKKLMVMLTAAATAIGLYAADPIDSTSFEAEGDFAEGVLVKGDKWSCADTEAKLLQGVYDAEKDPAYAYNETDNVRYSAFDAQANYLSVKTTFGKPLCRSIGETTVGDEAIFFDQLVKFTATDEDPTTEYADAKIIVYAQNMTPDDQTEDNHLMVRAGRIASGELTADTYDLGEIDLTEWHRLTIKANKVSANSIGFQVFVDGVAKAFTGKAPAYDAGAVAGFEASFKSLNTYKKLFPSLVTGLALTQVCFDGQGAIDDLIATTEPAGKWAEDATITLNWDPDQLTALTYAYGEVPATGVDDISSGTQVIPYIDGATVITLAPTYVEGFGDGVITGDEKILVDGLTFTASADGAVATFTAEDITPRIQIGGDTYPSFSKAIAAIGELGAGEVKTLKLNLPVEVDYNETDLVTEAFLQAGAGEIVIDLNGQTITGPGVADNFVILAEGKVTITDNSEDKLGKIVAGGEGEGAVKIQSADVETAGLLTINAGTFDGAVVLDEGFAGEYAPATASIVAGSFLKSANGVDKFTLEDSVAETSDLDDSDEDYFIVTELQQWTVTFKKDKDDVEPFATAQVVDGGFATAPEEDPTKDYYTFAGWNFDFATPIKENTTILAKWNAVDWTITYTDGVDTLTTATYNIDNRGEVVLDTEHTEKEGYDFDGWYWDAATKAKAEDFATKTGDQTLTGKWIAKTWTVTVTGGTADTEEYTTDDTAKEELFVNLEAEVPESKTFKTWVLVKAPEGVVFDDATAENATLTIPQGVYGDIEVEAQFESAEEPRPPVINGGSEEQKSAYDQWVKDAGITTPDAEINAEGFAAKLTAAEIAAADGDVEKAVEQKLDNEVSNIDMADVLAGNLEDAVADIQANYPDATVSLVEATIEGADPDNATFYKLSITFKPGNNAKDN